MPPRWLARISGLLATLTGIATALLVLAARSSWTVGWTRGFTPGQAGWMLQCLACGHREFRVDLPRAASDEWTCRRDGHAPEPKRHLEIPGRAEWILECPQCGYQECVRVRPAVGSDTWTCRRDGHAPVAKMQIKIPRGT